MVIIVGLEHQGLSELMHFSPQPDSLPHAGKLESLQWPLVTCYTHTKVFLVFKELLNVVSFVLILVIPYQMPAGCFFPHCLSILINFLAHTFRMFSLSPYYVLGTVSVARSAMAPFPTGPRSMRRDRHLNSIHN